MPIVRAMKEAIDAKVRKSTGLFVFILLDIEAYRLIDCADQSGMLHAVGSRCRMQILGVAI